jgi:hypothetical protein
MTPREQRIKQAQHMFRAANERMHQTIDGQVPNGALIPFLCECADTDCRGRISMDASDYEGIHIDRDLYIVLRDHPRVDGENVVGREDGYYIVSKAAA